jgi:hypothetical protein
MSTLHPPLEGAGRLVLSEAKYETGWGDLSAGTARAERSPHPAALRASTRPLEGRVKKGS